MTKFLLKCSHKNLFMLFASSIFVASTLTHFGVVITHSLLRDELRPDFGVSFQSWKCHFF